MSFTYLRVVSRSVGLTPVNGLYDVRLELSNRTITPVGTGEGSAGGSTGDFPYIPSGPVHYASGRIEYMSEGYGTSAGSSATTPGTNTTTVVQGDASVTLTEGITYNYHFLHTLDPTDLETSHQVGLADGGTWNSPHISTPGGDSTVLYEGSFTCISSNAGTHSITASAAGSGHILKAAALDWWIDPDDWVLVEEVPPASGQWVYGELVSITGSTGTTAWPFANGSLRLVMDGMTVSAASYDGATGSFDLGWEPPLGSQVWATYQGR